MKLFVSILVVLSSAVAFGRGSFNGEKIAALLTSSEFQSQCEARFGVGIVLKTVKWVGDDRNEAGDFVSAYHFDYGLGSCEANINIFTDKVTVTKVEGSFF